MIPFAFGGYIFMYESQVQIIVPSGNIALIQHNKTGYL